MNRAVKICGSAILAPQFRLAAEAFMARHPDIIVPVLVGNGSVSGIRAVIDGAADLALATAKMDAALTRHATRHGRELTVRSIGRDAVVPCVHRQNPLKNLSLADLARIFAGDITSWKQVDGPDHPISLFSYSHQQDIYESWVNLVMGPSRLYVTSKAKIADEDATLQEELTHDENLYSIGYLASSYLDSTAVTPLSINDVAATPDTIRSQTYPLTRTLDFVTAKTPSATVTDFLHFLLETKPGQSLLTAAKNVVFNL